MVKTNLKDLNQHLFETLERLNDDDLMKNEETAEREIKRSKAITNVAQTIINNANTVLDAAKLAYRDSQEVELPKMFMLEDKKE